MRRPKLRTVRCPACGLLAEVEKGRPTCGRPACAVQYRREVRAARARHESLKLLAALTPPADPTESGDDPGTDGRRADGGRPGRVD